MPVNITVPELSSAAAAGKSLFDENCAACHGNNAAGSPDGPPLVHIIYEPGHHSDASFYLAVSQGVRQHHWTFGNMPAQPHVSEKDVALIIEYVRELQAANGIR
ncbi:cytochrome c [Nitratireductor sp. XY-223]|uniref:c-type cytochrome n=1 Tax=Nitratireductor sp. XY-223 TaxID=2561926 RepID=UPI001FEF43C8|nr:cytochrome c [Nitratireductor sp. XY-223]